MTYDNIFINTIVFVNGAILCSIMIMQMLCKLKIHIASITYKLIESYLRIRP